MAKKLLTIDTINPVLKTLQDGEKTPILIRALEIERELRKGVVKNFTEVIRADLNDIQAMGQKPITFIRQVLTVCAYPYLMKDSDFPRDVKARANQILDECGGRSTGSYTYSEGIGLFREHLAEYLTKRDGFPAYPENIFLTAGSFEALRSILNVINFPHNENKIGVLVPVPRDPSFTSIFNEFGIVQINYYLEEDNDWSVNPVELCNALELAERYCIPKAILIINPGSPTGSVLTVQNMKQIVEFCLKRKLVLLTDEAYQFNAFAQGCQFVSFKKTVMQMGEPYNRLELVSIMSGSTGILGECGLRCGCSEMVNIKQDVINVYKKSICVKMCPSVMGQIALDCIIYPPQPDEESYDLFIQEWTAIMESLNEKAKVIINSLNSFDGFECKRNTGATFVFPKINIPYKAIEEAKSKGESPDAFYATNLLEKTGVCTMPGMIYGQLPGTYHLRLTILPGKAKMLKMLEIIRKFNAAFMVKFS